MDLSARRILSTHASKLLLALIAMWAVLIGNWVHPVVRFSWPPLNYAAMAMVFILPLVAAILAAWLPKRSAQIVAWSLLAIPTVAGALLAVFAFELAVETMRTGQDAMFEETDALRVGGSLLRAYQTDGGATTDFGFVVRQEKTILPGIIVVRTMYAQYHARGGRLRLVAPDSVQVIARADGVDAPGPILVVRPLLW